MKMGMTEPGNTFETGVRNIPGVLLEKEEVLSLLAAKVRLDILGEYLSTNKGVVKFGADFETMCNIIGIPADRKEEE